jgi:hypothetical protein
MPRKAMPPLLPSPSLSGAVALYKFALPGLSSARPQPPEMEVEVAMWLLRHSVPAAARQQNNPLGADAAAAGREVFKQNCETTAMMAVGGRGSGAENIRVRPFSVRSSRR